MGETKTDDAAPGGSLTARHLAEQGLKQQALGNDTEAERLLTEAQSMDADTVAEVLLREHDGGRAPDARLQDAADQDVNAFCRGSCLVLQAALDSRPQMPLALDPGSTLPRDGDAGR